MNESNKRATILKVRTKVARQMMTLGGERITQKGTVAMVKKSDSVMKQVKRKDYLRVLCCMRKGSVAMAIAVGLKLDDISRLEVNPRGNLRVYTPDHWMNLGVHYKKIEWD